MRTSKLKAKLGETCVTYFFVIGTAAFILPLINGVTVTSSTTWICIAVMAGLLILAYVLLVEKDDKPLSGKWKRIKVKKDTTIHVQEE